MTTISYLEMAISCYTMCMACLEILKIEEELHESIGSRCGLFLFEQSVLRLLLLTAH